MVHIQEDGNVEISNCNSTGEISGKYAGGVCGSYTGIMVT